MGPQRGRNSVMAECVTIPADARGSLCGAELDPAPPPLLSLSCQSSLIRGLSGVNEEENPSLSHTYCRRKPGGMGVLLRGGAG